MAHRALWLWDDNKIVSHYGGLRVLPTPFVLNGLSDDCSLVESCKDFDDRKLLGRIRLLTADLGAYGSG